MSHWGSRRAARVPRRARVPADAGYARAENWASSPHFPTNRAGPGALAFSYGAKNAQAPHPSYAVRILHGGISSFEAERTTPHCHDQRGGEPLVEPPGPLRLPPGCLKCQKNWVHVTSLHCSVLTKAHAPESRGGLMCILRDRSQRRCWFDPIFHLGAG